jgi:hypothetical protein
MGWSICMQPRFCRYFETAIFIFLDKSTFGKTFGKVLELDSGAANTREYDNRRRYLSRIGSWPKL